MKILNAILITTLAATSFTAFANTNDNQPLPPAVLEQIEEANDTNTGTAPEATPATEKETPPTVATEEEKPTADDATLPPKDEPIQ